MTGPAPNLFALADELVGATLVGLKQGGISCLFLKLRKGLVNWLDIGILPSAWQVRSESIRIDTPIAVIDSQVATGFVRDVATIEIFMNVESIVSWPSW